MEHKRGPISIHALLAESDAAGNKAGAESFKFLSTLSLRRATGRINDISRLLKISIHALLAESDWWSVDVPGWILGISIHALLAESDIFRKVRPAIICNFYPRSPCGERRPPMIAPVPPSIFLSTLSLRRATVSSRRYSTTECYFYPRSPCGERRA